MSAARAGIDPERVYLLTIQEVLRQIDAFHFRYQMEQSNFREVVYMLAAVNRDPKKQMPQRHKIWPIPHIDELRTEKDKGQEDIGRALLDHYKKLGKI